MRNLQQERPPRRRLARVLPAAGVLAVLALPLMAAESDKVDIDGTRDMLQQWVETQRIISEEKKELALAREMLNERIALVQSEIDALRGKITDAEKSIAEADKKRGEMLDENDRLKQAATALEDTLVALEQRTQALLPRLPAPAREHVQPLSQRIPRTATEADKLSTAQRFQNVVGILNELNKKHRVLAVTSEVRELPDGSSAEVTALYLGLGYGYYTGAKGTLAGVGYATADGWVWEPANEYAEAIATAVAIYKNEHVASFVRVPVNIQ